MVAPCLSSARKPPLIKWGTDPGSSFGPFHCVLLLSNYETVRAADTSIHHIRDPKKTTTRMCILWPTPADFFPTLPPKVSTPILKVRSPWGLVPFSRNSWTPRERKVTRNKNGPWKKESRRGISACASSNYKMGAVLLTMGSDLK